MLKKIKSVLGGNPNARLLKPYEERVPAINALESEYEALSDAKLRAKTDEFKTRLNSGEELDDLLPEAFAVVREAAKRTLKQRHYDVQLVGGMILHDRAIAEMRTGEGKTLVATLPVYLNALTGKGVHLVTVNDYLASRDASWMGQVYAFLGMSIGVINSNNQSFLYDESYAGAEVEESDEERDEEGYYRVTHEFLRPCDRKEAYQADITYGTNNEFGFDYLRDNITYHPNDIRQRGHRFAIIDEIDSVLIDEARTPLIISAPTAKSEDLYRIFADVARSLKPGEDYEIDEKKRAIQLTDAGIEKAEKALNVDNIYTEKGILYVHHLETAVRAKALFERDKNYVVRDGQVLIVDEFTGRILAGRRYSEGLHQALEAKEGLELRRESRTFASITYQNYFRMYDGFSGMTGTAMTSQEEFFKVYGLETIAVPTHRPIARVDHDDLIFQTEKGKYEAIVAKVHELQERGQPVLIGTVSIEKNQELSEFLAKNDISYEALNAKNHEREGEIIAKAGRKSAVTLATNMAGRGVDIKLGGENATQEEYEHIKSLGGLFVLGTERHNARRIDNQLRGRCGRQGDPGETQFFVSLEDELMRVFAADTIKNMMGTFGIAEDQPIENKIITRSLESAQTRIEGMNFDARRAVLDFDNVLNKQRQSLYDMRRRVLLGDNADIHDFLVEIASPEDNIEEVLNEKAQSIEEDEMYAVARRMILQSIDMLWVEHLEVMDFLRGSVNLRGYGQRDPIVEYQREGRRMFQELLLSINEQILKLIPAIGEGAFKAERRQLKEVADQAEVAERSSQGQQTVRHEEKIGRNELVTIGNGSEEKKMKYKKAQPLIESGEWKIISS